MSPWRERAAHRPGAYRPEGDALPVQKVAEVSTFEGGEGELRPRTDVAIQPAFRGLCRAAPALGRAGTARRSSWPRTAGRGPWTADADAHPERLVAASAVAAAAISPCRHPRRSIRRRGRRPSRPSPSRQASADLLEHDPDGGLAVVPSARPRAPAAVLIPGMSSTSRTVYWCRAGRGHHRAGPTTPPSTRQPGPDRLDQRQRLHQHEAADLEVAQQLDHHRLDATSSVEDDLGPE